MSTRACSTCQVVLPIAEFRWENKAAGKRKYRCGSCENARMRQYRADNREAYRAADRNAYRRKADKVRTYNLKRFYKLTDAETAAVEAAETCDICGRDGGSRRLMVDHCHQTDINRGVLCNGCNAALGQFQDDPERMRKAADYVEQRGFGFFERIGG